LDGLFDRGASAEVEVDTLVVEALDESTAVDGVY
jgi:hypothetical protein